MSRVSPKIVRLFRELADHTAPECANNCRIPHSCCDAVYCAMTEDYARNCGVELKHTDHPTLKFMGPNGCTVEPHLRPLCTYHTCAINGFGFKPNDPDWTAKYFKLRDEIEIELETLL